MPDTSITELGNYGVTPVTSVNPDFRVKVLRYETEKGHELWLGLKNFYVITRYNHSQLYAMAVYQLSMEILKDYESRS